MRLKNSIVVEQNGTLLTSENYTRYDADGKPVSREQITLELENRAGELYRKLKNDNTGVSVSDLADFQALSTMDIEVQASQMPDNIADRLVHDGTPRNNGINSAATSQTVSIREFLDPVGYFEEIRGTNDHVPMMDKLASSETMELKIVGLGYKDSLINILGNTLDNPSGVNRAFARALVIEKNREVLAPILGANYAGNSIPAATGGTFLQNLYDTLFKAVATLMTNTYTIAGLSAKVGDLAGRTIILLPSGIAQLAKMRDRDTQLLSVSDAIDAEILGVSQPMVAPYGKKSPPTTLYGIPSNKGYVIRLPDSMESHLRVTPVEVLSKTGEASVLTGGSLEMAHFRYSGVFNKYLLPNGAGKGCIVEINLPSPTA